MEIHKSACITAAIAVSLWTCDLNAETVPAGVQFRTFTSPKESYEPSRIAGRLREIDQGCAARSLSPQLPEYAYIGSLGSRLPLPEDVVLQLMAMSDIMDSQMEHMPSMSRDKRSAWGSPAANVLIAAGADVKPVIEKRLADWEGKPQHQVLLSVLSEIQTQIAVQEHARDRPKKHSASGHSVEKAPPLGSDLGEPVQQSPMVFWRWRLTGLVVVTGLTAWVWRRK